MKKISFLLLSLGAMLVLTHCSSPSVSALCSDAANRGKLISELTHNEAYMTQVMDTMKINHPEIILAHTFVITKSDEAMRTEMLTNMMGMATSDSAMCKMLMGKTMAMCDDSKAMCKMMIGSMQSHPKSMKCMQEMGMCDAKGK